VSDQDYLRQIELLARDVVVAAQDEGSLAIRRRRRAISLAALVSASRRA